MTIPPPRRVLFQPATYRALQEGINQVVDAVRPTLGPLAGIAAITRADASRTPELLDNGGVIARRIIELADRDQDMGAMLIRHLLWRVYERAGDGTATAAVLYQSIFDEGVRCVAAGGNAMRMRRGLEQGMAVILATLSPMTRPVRGKLRLAQVAESTCGDPPLAAMLGEIFDIIGEYGQLDIRPGSGRELEREYVEGMFWNGGLVSRRMIRGQGELRTELYDPAILISDLDLQEPAEVAPLLLMVDQAGIKGLLLVARGVSDSVTALLLSVSQAPERFQVIAVPTPGPSADVSAAALEDLAALTCGRLVVTAAGATLASVTPEDLGRARRAWANLEHFGIVGGKGDVRGLRSHLARLRAAFGQAEDVEARKKLQERIGKLMGGYATLWVGGATEAEIATRKDVAERTAEALRGAVREGVVPGGGVALLACRSALRQKFAACKESEERLAYRILIQALEAPFRALMTNAGYDPSAALARLAGQDPGHGIDVRSGQVVDVAQAGIWDSAAVLRTVVAVAVSGAALALTTDVMIHRKNPEKSMEP